MAYEPFVRLTYGGDLGCSDATGIGVEHWECNLALFFADNAAFVTLTHANELMSIFTTFFNTDQFIAQTSLLYVKLSNLDASGHLIGDSVMSDPAPAVGLSDSGTIYPFQTAFCVSLLTDLRGAHNRGRNYLPMPVAGITGNTGQILPAVADEIQEAFASTLSSVASYAETNGDGILGIASKSGSFSEVTSIRVGLIPDTQRRRRRSLVEDYQAATTI